MLHLKTLLISVVGCGLVSKIPVEDRVAELELFRNLFVKVVLESCAIDNAISKDLSVGGSFIL
jgi:hypothetical protein